MLEAEPDLRVDSAVVSGATATKSTKATARRRGLSKQTRSDLSDRVVKVDVVQNVVEVERERQVVTARRTATTTETATAKTATAAATRTTHATAAHNCARATFIARPLTLVLLTGVSTAAFRTKRPRLADTQVYGRRARPLAEVARNHHVARCRSEERRVGEERKPHRDGQHYETHQDELDR